jgi:hypothetical protein
MVENSKPTTAEEVIKGSEFLPLLKLEAEERNLNVYVFDNEEVKKYYNTKSEDLGIALLAKDEDNAKYNLRTLRKCYLIRYKE